MGKQACRQGVFGEPRAAALAAGFAAPAAIAAFILRRRLEAMWAEILRENPRLPAALPLLLWPTLLGAAAALALARLLAE